MIFIPRGHICQLSVQPRQQTLRQTHCTILQHGHRSRFSPRLLYFRVPLHDLPETLVFTSDTLRSTRRDAWYFLEHKLKSVLRRTSLDIVFSDKRKRMGFGYKPVYCSVQRRGQPNQNESEDISRSRRLTCKDVWLRRLPCWSSIPSTLRVYPLYVSTLAH